MFLAPIGVVVRRLIAPADGMIAKRIRILSGLCAALVCTAGAIVLIGWAFEFNLLKSVRPDWVTMKPNAALCFGLSGAVLFFLLAARRNPAFILLARGASILVFAIATVTLAEIVFDVELGFDQLLFNEPGNAVHTMRPGLMSPVTAASFILAATAFWLTAHGRDGGAHRAVMLRDGLLLLILLASLLALVGYVFDVPVLHGLPRYTRMSMVTAVAFALLSLAGFCAVPEAGLAAFVARDAPGSLALRRLLVPVVVGPIMLGWIVMAGRRAGFYGDPFDLSLLVLSTIAVAGALLLYTAYRLNLIDVERTSLLVELQRHRDTLQQEVVNATRELRASEDRYRALIQNTDTGYVVLDKRGRVLDANEPFLGLTGAESLELLKGRSILEWTAPEARHSTTAAAEQARRDGLLNDFETVFLRSDGSRAVVSVHATLEQSPEGTRFVAMCRDVTRRSQAEADLRSSEEHFRSVMRYSPIGKAIVAPNGRILDVNNALCRIVGYSREELLRRDTASITHPDDYDRERTFNQQLLDREIETYEIEGRYLHQAGHAVWVQQNVSLVRDAQEEPLHFIAQVLDVTERKQVSEALRENADKLTISNRELDDFAYIVSHDLKEPLRGIHNYSAFLLEDYDDKLDAEGKSKLQTLMRLTGRLEDLLDSLLFYSRVGRSGMAKKETDIGAVVSEIVDSMQEYLRERGARVAAAPLPIVVCDSARVGEVFRNLITNAVKYNDNDEKSVEVGWLSAQSGAPVFFVRDNGIGIPERHHDKVFTIFKRLHARDKYGGGTGSGLTIVRKIVEQHGGRIWLESERGSGSTFFFTLSPDV